MVAARVTAVPALDRLLKRGQRRLLLAARLGEQEGVLAAGAFAGDDDVLDADSLCD